MPEPLLCHDKYFIQPLYGLAGVAADHIMEGKKVVYVVHSVHTAEPYDICNPFGGLYDIEDAFRSLCHRADAIVCVSEAEKLKLEQVIEESRGKIQVIYNGITMSSYEFQREIKENRKTFGYLGRLDYRKGILETLKGLKDLPELEYYLACGKGDYSYLKEVKNYIEAADMEERIHFLGFCTGERRRKFLETLDCLIISSLYEPFGCILLEALDADVPILCSNNGGLAEIMGDYKYQYHPYEAGGFQKALRDFLNASTEEIKEECKNLKERLRKFSREEMVTSYNQLFESLSNFGGVNRID